MNGRVLGMLRPARSQTRAALEHHPMNELTGRLAFIQQAEALKNVLRSAHTSTGRRESTAEHTWRLCLMAMVFADDLGPVDLAQVLQLCVVHDLGEALNGDIPATAQHQVPDKSERERRDLLQLMQPLSQPLQARLLALWEDYEFGRSREARLVKALDKLETLIQHNQGANPPGFDYAFNLGYGRKHTDGEPLMAAIRERVDADTRRHAEQAASPATAGTQSDAVAPVQQQLDAYNARDLAAFIAPYATDVRIYRPPAPDPVLVGQEAMAAHYAAHRFNLPGLHAEVVARQVVGQKVIDHERISGLGPAVVEAVAVYQVAAGKIQNVWFYDAA
jgi:putative hydrolase of HD superfamily